MLFLRIIDAVLQQNFSATEGQYGISVDVLKAYLMWKSLLKSILRKGIKSKTVIHGCCSVTVWQAGRYDPPPPTPSRPDC